MVTPISQPQKLTSTSIFYVNDEHSNIPNMERLVTASDQFDYFTPTQKTDKLKFSEGDFALGTDKKLNTLAVTAQNIIGIMASAGGNHEFDINKKDLAEVLKNHNYKLLGINLEIPQTSEENKEISKEITNSYIQEKNGTKYGVIGLLPFDFTLHVTDPQEYKDFHVLSIDETIPRVQKEIDNMKKQGVNKIIVLSHAGYDSDVKLAQSVEGIDIILGGHTHDLIKGVQEGKNLFYSKKTGEPTIITQAGKNGDYFGVLNVQFDENGIIKTVQNNVIDTSNYPKNLIMRHFIDMILGKPKTVGTINSAPNEKISLTKENASADFINDIIRQGLDVDLVIMNSGGMRSSFEAGVLTDRDLKNINPFKNKLCIARLSEKDIVDAIKAGAASMKDENNMPGILQVSGLKYTMTKSGEVKQISFVSKDGKETPINVDHPDPNKTYRVGLDDFVLWGGNHYLPNKYDQAEEKFDFDKNKLITDYMAKSTKPIDIKADGRIQIIN